MIPRILAIDPGTTQFGWCLYAEGMPQAFGVCENGAGLLWIPQRFGAGEFSHDVLAIEMVKSYGMLVGEEVFRTVWWAGRFAQAWGHDERLVEVFRADVKLELCKSARANDSNIRQAIIDMYGGKDAAIGKKATPGPLYRMQSHAWSALAVAITAAERLRRGEA